MPVQFNNIVMAGIRGALGKQVVFRQRAGKTVISAYPDMDNIIRSPKQLAVNETMKLANEYAHSIMQDTEQRKEAQFRLDVPSTRLYTSLIREFFRMEKEKGSKEKADTTAAAVSQTD